MLIRIINSVRQHHFTIIISNEKKLVHNKQHLSRQQVHALNTINIAEQYTRAACSSITTSFESIVTLIRLE